MRILHVLDHGLPVQSGYTFRTRAILKAQEAQGWTVAAVTGPRWQPGAGTEEVDGLLFHRTPAPRPLPPVLREIAEVRAFARAIDAAAEAFRPDVIHAHSPVLNALAAARVARARGLPLVYEIRAFWEDAAVGNGTGREGSLRYRLTRALETRAARRAGAVAVICEGLRADLVARGVDAGKILVAPNGVDLSLFGAPAARDPALAATLGIADDDEVTGFIGSFYDYEGLPDLIAAAPALVERRPCARLLLVGGGPMEDALRAQAAASPVADRIIFCGRVPHGEVERYYALVDVLAYPRRAMRLTELVTPLKPLEAMAQGRLVAASDVGGHRELIRDGATGALFAPDSPPAIADALAALFADRAGWDARRARARAFVEAERNWASNISRYRPVYQRLIAARHGTRMADPSSPTRPTIAVAPAGAAVAALVAGIAALAAPAAWAEAAVTGMGLPALFAPAAPPLGWTARAALAGGAALLAAAIAWSALILVLGERRIAVRLPARRAAGVRRADRHPDAPPRAPIRAAHEFGPAPDLERAAAGRALPADWETLILSYADPATLAPGERIAAVELSPAACAEPASLEALLARLERGARAVRLAPAPTSATSLEEALGALKRSAA